MHLSADVGSKDNFNKRKVNISHYTIIIFKKPIIKTFLIPHFKLFFLKYTNDGNKENDV